MPWEVYLRSGDIELLRKAYGAQLKLMGFWRQSFNSSGVLTRWSTQDGDNYLGDHATPHGNEGSAGDEAALLNNCYVLYCTRLMSNISKVLTPASFAFMFGRWCDMYINSSIVVVALAPCKVLGNETGAAAFAEAADRHAAAIHARFFNATLNGYVDTRQGHLILALVSGSVPPSLRDSVLETLRHEILVRQGGHIDTGLTTTYLMYLVREHFSRPMIISLLDFCTGL
jgi:hypothetical protein|eukprot:COSAG03_NODE_3317_length_2085_cov_22.860806_1_plen_228_part_00